MSSVRIGRIANGGKIHLAIDARTRCGSRASARIAIDAAPMTVTTKTLCKRCMTPTNLDIARSRTISGRFDARLDDLLFRIREAIATPEEKAIQAELIERLRQSEFGRSLAAPVEPYRPRSLREIRDDFATTHKTGRRPTLAPAA